MVKGPSEAFAKEGKNASPVLCSSQAPAAEDGENSAGDSTTVRPWSFIGRQGRTW